MAFTIDLSSDGNYICLTRIAETALSEYEEGRVGAIAAIKSHQIFRLLVDVRNVTSSLSILEHFEFTSSHTEHLPRGVKIAVLMRPDIGDATFIENVAINRRVNMKVFTYKQKAVK